MEGAVIGFGEDALLIKWLDRQFPRSEGRETAAAVDEEHPLFDGLFEHRFYGVLALRFG